MKLYSSPLPTLGPSVQKNHPPPKTIQRPTEMAAATAIDTAMALVTVIRTVDGEIAAGNDVRKKMPMETRK